MNPRNAKSIISLAFYLPQFHAVPENDQWWGPGFTEWSQVGAWEPFFRGHSLRRPTEPLGAYNLLNPQTLETQMNLASSHGVDGFAVWDYWFGNGERLLDKPIELVLRDRLRFKYCLAWANHSWKNWEKGILLREQRYLGARDYEAYFRHSARHFRSENYIKIDNKPVFIIHDPVSVPDLEVFTDTWQSLARESGFAGIYFIGERVTPKHTRVASLLDACADSAGFWRFYKTLPWNFFKNKLRTKLNLVVGGPQRFDYWTMVKDSIPERVSDKFVPTVFTGWDTTPRHGRRGVVFNNFNEEQFAKHLQDISSFVSRRAADRTVLLIKSWNEWAEGNVMEPDTLFGNGILNSYNQFSSQFNSAKLNSRIPSLVSI